MKNITLIVSFLMLANTLAISQSLKKYERKAHKTFKKEAYGMTLYYSEAILRIDSTHEKATQWSAVSRKALLLDKSPTELKRMHAAAIPFTEVIQELTEKEKSPTESLATLVVTTFNQMDSSVLNNTYIGVTNDGFGKGSFVQNDASNNTAFLQIPTGHFFTVTGTKNGFTSGSAAISTKDVSAFDTLLCELHLSPSWGLPTELYFDYEKPSALDPSNTTTNISYEEAWVDYLYRINEYIDSNSVSDSLVHRAEAQKEVGSFFVHSVDANYGQLKTICGLLEDHLQAGYKITLAIEGHAGPFEEGDDPQALIKRRLHSVENYFSFYKDGIFQPWLANRNLIIERQVTGATSQTTSHTTTDAFTIEAAKARKVIIKMVEVVGAK
ncbi:MAG: hypothetical protein AAFZ15_19145 [Bacteroidota bacterium]